MERHQNTPDKIGCRGALLNREGKNSCDEIKRLHPSFVIFKVYKIIRSTPSLLHFRPASLRRNSFSSDSAVSERGRATNAFRECIRRRTPRTRRK